MPDEMAVNSTLYKSVQLIVTCFFLSGFVQLFTLETRPAPVGLACIAGAYAYGS